MKKEKSKRLLLFLTFLKIGAFTFGGGYAMIPMIQKEIVERNKWLNDDDILDIVAIAESTPGPIAINAATFVGYHVSGFSGAVLTSLGVVLPSFFIISLISLILKKFEDIQVVQFAFSGIRVGVLALIVKALWSMYKQCNEKPIAYLIMAVAFILAAFIKINVILVIVICGIFGLVSSLIIRRKQNDLH